jgi:hypothetical protein
MIRKLTCQVTFEVNDFTQSKISIPSDIELRKCFKKGDLIESGRSKGENSENDVCFFDGTLDAVAEFILSQELIFKNPLNSLSVTLLISYQDQCNFELTTHEINKLKQLNVPIGVTCYESLG